MKSANSENFIKNKTFPKSKNILQLNLHPLLQSIPHNQGRSQFYNLPPVLIHTYGDDYTTNMGLGFRLGILNVRVSGSFLRYRLYETEICSHTMYAKRFGFFPAGTSDNHLLTVLGLVEWGVGDLKRVEKEM